MDTLTHALSGALLARAVVPRANVSPRAGTARCLAFRRSIPRRRCRVFARIPARLSLSPSRHYPLDSGVAAVGPGLAWVWSRLRRNPAGFKAYFLVSAAAVAIHILGDVITSFGTMVFAPLSDMRVQWDTTFIIDLWFSIIILAGLLVSVFFGTSRYLRSHRCCCSAATFRSNGYSSNGRSTSASSMRCNGPDGGEGERAAAPGVAFQLDGGHRRAGSLSLRFRQPAP